MIGRVSLYACLTAGGCGRVAFDELRLESSDAGPDATVAMQALRIASAVDNGSIYASDLSSGCAFGHFHAGASFGTPLWAYLRFTLDGSLGPNETVGSARLEVMGVDSQHDPNTHYLIVAAEASADAPVVSSFGDRPNAGGGRPLATPTVRWPETGGLPWNIGGGNVAPDLAPILQSLVDTYGGLAAGAHVQLWFSMVEPGSYIDIGFGGYCDESLDRSATLAIESW